MIIRDREHLGKKDLIKGCIAEHQAGLQRMDMLYRAYKGEADILKRTMLDGLPKQSARPHLPALHCGDCGGVFSRYACQLSVRNQVG